MGARTIIAVWNDDEDLDEVDMELALRDLQRDSSLPAGLHMVLYGSKWCGSQQLWCFPMKTLDGDVQQWANELEAVRVSTAIAATVEMCRPNEGAAGDGQKRAAPDPLGRRL